MFNRAAAGGDDHKWFEECSTAFSRLHERGGVTMSAAHSELEKKSTSLYMRPETQIDETLTLSPNNTERPCKTMDLHAAMLQTQQEAEEIRVKAHDECETEPTLSQT